MTSEEHIVELALSTKVVARVNDGEWTTSTVESLLEAFPASKISVLVWGGKSVRTAEVQQLSELPFVDSMNIHKVTVGGEKIRCSAKSKWPVIGKRGEVSYEPASALKSGSRVVSHPRFGKDALHNLVGYQGYDPMALAQVKTAHERLPLAALSVRGGGSILLSNGAFLG